MLPPPVEKKRIGYIDYIKALTIIGVVNVHSNIPPTWLTPLLVNAIFFFIAGMFFKKPNLTNLMRDYSGMLVKDCRTMLIPFMFFYTLSYPFIIIVHLWDNRTLAGFDWWCFFDLFDICGRSDYLFVNVPLWFILCLFVIKSIYYFVRCLPAGFILLIALVALCLKDFWEGIATPLMINNAFYWLGFFALGNLFAQYVFPLNMSICRRLIIVCISLVAILASLCIEDTVPEMTLGYIRVFAAISLLLFGFSLLEHARDLRILSFIGQNTLIILGCHLWFLVPLERLSYKLTRVRTVWTGTVQTVLCVCLCLVFIHIGNKYFPLLVGKFKKMRKLV